MNNEKSGMIYDREMARYDHAVHTNKDSGYGCPIWKDIAHAYGMEYSQFEDVDFTEPTIVELYYQQEQIPYIPQGEEIQNMYPRIPEDLYNQLNTL